MTLCWIPPGSPPWPQGHWYSWVPRTPEHSQEYQHLCSLAPSHSTGFLRGQGADLNTPVPPLAPRTRAVLRASGLHKGWSTGLKQRIVLSTVVVRGAQGITWSNNGTQDCIFSTNSHLSVGEDSGVTPALHGRVLWMVTGVCSERGRPLI
jgi:hypothetical protein